LTASNEAKVRRETGLEENAEKNSMYFFVFVLTKEKGGEYYASNPLPEGG